ncbi:MAG: hypothetical protein SAJ12_16975, partial [Jaaginema sp. PMC 1079.18]|nr:hypothetical protein [Jaaginema sp. PMC 1079.18]
MEINFLESRIRDFINSPRKQAILQKDAASWNKLSSALDVVGDTQLAIESHSKFEQVTNYGECYIVIYGILQALLIQQDAVKAICEVLEIRYKLPEQLIKIRKVRNSSSGHPIYQTENKVVKSSFIDRCFMSSSAFHIIDVFSNDEESKRQFISIPDLIIVQNKHISEKLEQIIKELERKEMEHRKKHKSQKLVDVFPQTLTYHIGNISEATFNKEILSCGIASLQVISKYLDDFKNELSKRSEWGLHDGIDHYYE